MADTETETTAAPAKTLTGYVLFECDDRGAWMPVMHVHSRKAEDAITEYIEHELGTDEEPGGMFAAVPARS